MKVQILWTFGYCTPHLLAGRTGHWGHFRVFSEIVVTKTGVLTGQSTSTTPVVGSGRKETDYGDDDQLDVRRIYG